MIIISSSFNIEPGTIMRDQWMTDHEGEYHKVTFRVMERATLEEFRQYIEETKCKGIPAYHRPYFYKISMD